MRQGPRVVLLTRQRYAARPDTAALCRAACLLGEDYLFERHHIATDDWFRWAFVTPTGFVTARSYDGPGRGGRPVVGPKRRSSGVTGADEVPDAYRGGFRSTLRSGYSSPRSAPNRRATLGSIIEDREVRRAKDIGVLLDDQAAREAGWSIRELLGVATNRVAEYRRAAEYADNRRGDLEDRLRTANRQADVWREHAERVARPQIGGSEAYGYARENPPRPVLEKRYTDPYSSVKRTRFSYDRPDTRAAPSQVAAGSSVPVPRNDPERGVRRNPYAEDPYSVDRYYR